MRINEVAELAGVTAKNIRFYEQEKLLFPQRDEHNRYRNYSESDLEMLKKIRLLRSLDMPVSEIRSVIQEEQSLQSAVRRHLVLLENRKSSLEAAYELCRALAESDLTLCDLSPDQYLSHTKQQMLKGVCFVDVKNKDIKRKKKLGAAFGAGVFILLMLLILLLISFGHQSDPLPTPIFLLLCAIPVICIGGAIAALYGRYKEIKGENENDYSDY